MKLNSRIMRNLTRLLLPMLALSCFIIMPTFAMADEPQAPTEKDETVYVYTDANGEINKVEVSALLKNGNSSASLLDSTNLTDLKGKDDAAYSTTGDSVVWEADGNNVSYTGTSSDAVPVTLHVTYTLDGATVTPSQLAGKTGHVTMRYTFQNHSSTTVTINGCCQTIYTPFTCISAIMLDGKDFKNVSVENCKVINDGDDMIVAGYAMPGLKESLGSVGEDADVPDSFTISADVTDFELKSTMTVVTAGIMSEIDPDSLGLELDGDAGALTDAMQQLISGSDTLTSGLDTLADKLKELEEGTAGIKEGASKISGGLNELAGDQNLGALASGMRDLEDGATGISGGAQRLASGLAELAGENGLGGLEQGEIALGSAIAEMGSKVSAMEEGLSKAADGLSEAGQLQPVFDGALGIMQDSEKMQKMLESGALTQEEYRAVVSALTAGSVMSGSVSNVAGELQDSVTAVDALVAGIAELGGNVDAIASGLSKAKDAASSLASGASTLEEYAAQLNEATPLLAEGASTAADAASQLADGAKQLDDYADKLNQAAPALAEGAQEAAKGSKTLTEGMQAFNDEGVSKLVDAIQEELGGMNDRITALSEASKSYSNFSGITKGTTGTVKFVIETEAVKKS